MVNTLKCDHVPSTGKQPLEAAAAKLVLLRLSLRGLCRRTKEEHSKLVADTTSRRESPARAYVSIRVSS